MAVGFLGARFYKTDLQAQTPENGSSWMRDDPIRLPSPRTEADLQNKARAYLERCHEVGLEVIGVTDHNFSGSDNPRDWFLTHLIQQNRTVAQRLGRAPLVILPGFEVDIGYHLLCLFDPRTDLRRVSGCLTTLGLSEDLRYAGGVPSPCRFEGRNVPLETVLKVVQVERHGIVVAAHAFSTNGIADDSRDAADYSDERLLAVEVNAFPFTGRAEAVLSGRATGWQRKRPPAAVMSSDCKRLRPTSDTDTNYLGYRSTWIKMSRPSVEGLRQAFLDPDSRIRFGSRPEDGYQHPRVRSVAIQGARFLRDVQVGLSPSLTTIIGGRGTGKSTFVEYMRLGLAQVPSLRGEEPIRNFQKILETLTPTTGISIEIEKEGQVWALHSEGQGPPMVDAGPSVPPDIARFFPVRILSQREIYSIAEDRDARSRLVDDLIRSELDELSLTAQGKRQAIEELSARIAQEGALQQRKRTLDTEVLDLQVKLERLKELAEPLRSWKTFIADERRVAELEAEAERIASVIRTALHGLEPTGVAADARPDDINTGQTGHSPAGDSRITEAVDELTALRASLANAIAGALDAFEHGTAVLLEAEAIGTWRAELSTAREAYEELRKELAAEATDPEQYLQYEEDLASRRAGSAAVAGTLRALVDQRLAKDRLFRELESTWRSETDQRRRVAERWTATVPLAADQKPFVRIAIDAFGDDRALADRLQEFVRDHRRIGTDDWGAFDERRRLVLPEDSFIARLVRARDPDQSPIALFMDWLRELRAGMQPANCPWPPEDRKVTTLLEWATEQALDGLRTWRPPDRIRVELYHRDGAYAGELEGGLSVGQRCTAILALLLTQDDVPLIVDQPEEDLDNEFVYRELVPLIRDAKGTRQVILVTHNANLPVNGDAELIVALEAVQGRGQLRRTGRAEAIGALDQKVVRVAVEEILEGSEDAFRKRYEKYGF